jgi:hypothetical protein
MQRDNVLDFGAGITFRIFIAGTVVWNAVAPSRAFAQIAAEKVDQQQVNPSDALNNGADFVRPMTLFHSSIEARTAPGGGSTSQTTSVVTTGTENLRGIARIDIAPLWALSFRADLPFEMKMPIYSGQPEGQTIQGLSDADVQMAVAHEFDQRWGAGIGARLYAPTGEGPLSTGKWQIMPGGAVRYDLTEVSPGSYFEPLAQYAISFAGNPSARKIRTLEFQPALNIGLPDRWFFTFYPSADIQVNYGDKVKDQTGKLFLPFDAWIGRKFNENLIITLEVGVPIIKDYPVYNYKVQTYVNLVF